MWTVIGGALAAALIWSVWRIAARRPRRSQVGWAMAFGLAGGALSHRIGLPNPWAPDPFGRPLPLIWIGVAAALGATVALWRSQAVSAEG